MERHVTVPVWRAAAMLMLRARTNASRPLGWGIAPAFLLGLLGCGTCPAQPKSDHTLVPGLGPVGDRHVVLTADGFTVSTVRQPGRYRILLQRSSGAMTQIELPDTPWDVSEVHAAAGGRAVAVLPAKDGGGAGLGSRTVYVLGSRPPALLDQFQCEMPSLSPDGRALAFVAYYPEHFAPDDATSNFVMLYDLTRNGRDRGRIRRDFPLADDPDRQAGMQLYPATRATPTLPGSGARIKAVYQAYDFAWSPDSSRLLFVSDEGFPPEDGAGSAAAVREFLVMATFREAGPRVFRARMRECSARSGVSCGVDTSGARFGGARFGPNGLTVRQYFGTDTKSGRDLYAGYRDFVVIR